MRDRGRAGCAAALVLTAGVLSGMDWPSPVAVMQGSFGWNDQGRPELGTSFTAPVGSPVGAAEQGEILYVGRTSTRASRLPDPLGEWVALDHGDGIISVYGRLGDELTPPVPGRLDKSAVLGTAGRSGWSVENGFYFSLFDRKERRWINPARIITLPQDTRAPVVQAVTLRDETGKTFAVTPGSPRTVSQGRYVIAVDAVDTLAAGGVALAPFRVICSINGNEVGSLGFETYSARDGMLMAYRNGLVPVREVYAPFPAYEVGEARLVRGQAALEIITQDIAGNSSTTSFRIIVE